ncbi:hypothetical protein ELH66_08090 [Rhizobium ruizarguesonis]|uniref:AAA family ATPase n=1 Tax=Rhizobium ruizarguesonis TaxID=2081791 RepID=UPI0010326B85|nr:AAA family ATPase [Rhizobium ruizarguesonis]TBA20959.1 hypothetical protein ELH66_08090 [Rhizobium ruizarguesonis]
MSTITKYAPEFTEAAQAIFNSLDPAAQKRAQILGRMNASYVGSKPRDGRLDLGFDGLIENVAATLFGEAAKQRAMMVVGESGSGKTTAIKWHIAKRPQFGPRINSNGDEVRTLVYMEAKKPLTIKGLARGGLEALGYPLAATARMTEQELFDLWKLQLRENQVLYLWIDEMQHVLRGDTTKEIQNVADILKSLVQLDGWPLHLILSGVPDLAKFIHLFGDADGQLKERSNLVELLPLVYPQDRKRVERIIIETVTKHAGLLLSKDLLPEAPDLQDAKADRTTTTVEKQYQYVLSGDFVDRVLHASKGQFGSIIQKTRAACENALRLESDTIHVANFAAAYAAGGCRPSQNIFLAENWTSIDPDHSVADLVYRKRGPSTAKNRSVTPAKKAK